MKKINRHKLKPNCFLKVILLSYVCMTAVLCPSCNPVTPIENLVAEITSDSGSEFPSYVCNLYGEQPIGYYFFNTYKIGNYADTSHSYQFILDHTGQVVYYKKTGVCFDFKIQANTCMSYYSNGKFYIKDSSFTVIDSVQCIKGIDTDLHDFQLLSTGNYLLIGTEIISMDLSQNKIFQTNKLTGSKNAYVRSAVIQELDKNKNLIFEWHAINHFKFDEVDAFYINDTLNVNWTHANSIEKDKDGNYLLTVRNFNELTKIDGKNGTLLWRLGGKKNQFTFFNDSLPVLGMHDGRMQKNGDISLFDNGSSFASLTHQSRAVLYMLDEREKKAKIRWQKLTGIYSKARGNFHCLSNGNYLINFGEIKNENKMFCVVKPGGEKIMEIQFKDTLASYRAFFYAALPFKLQRPVVTRYKKHGKIYLDAGNSYKSYHWSTGETTQTILITAPGRYSVFVPIGDGGFISSPKFTIKDL